MIRRPPRSTQSRSSAASDVYKRQVEGRAMGPWEAIATASDPASVMERVLAEALTLIPSAEGAAIQLCATRASLVITTASGNLGDSVGSVQSVGNSLSG